MSFRRCLTGLLAVGHLVVVVCGACYCLPVKDGGPAAEILLSYATVSGASSGYGFFAPEVGAAHRARFILRDDSGSTWPDAFDETNSLEARLRLMGIVDNAFMDGTAAESPEWRKLLVRSWAATMFARHPSAVSLTVIVEAYEVPKMADFRAGARPSWQVVYRAEVRRRVPVDSEGSKE